MPSINLLELRTAALGALLALLVLALGKLARWILARRLTPPAPREAQVLRSEAERVEGELRVLTAEMENRLDVKLDRLECLLKQAQSLEPAGRPAEVRRPPASTARWDPLGAVNNADRNRVLELASLGELPEAIAGSVGLLRGEVDLILRLHRSSTERLQDS